VNQKSNRGFIQYIVLIAVVLGVVFLSQQPFLHPYEKKAYAVVSEQANLYWTKASLWFTASIYPRVAQEVANRGEPLQSAVVEQKNNLAQSVWENIKNFFAEKFSKVSGTKVK